MEEGLLGGDTTGGIVDEEELGNRLAADQGREIRREGGRELHTSRRFTPAGSRPGQILEVSTGAHCGKDSL